MAVHLEHSNSTSTAAAVGANNILRETVRNPNGVIMTNNNFTNQFFTTFKSDVSGKYTVTIYNLAHTPVSVGAVAGNLPFVVANNQVNLNSLSGIIVGVILTITGIIILIAGIIVLILDRRRTRPKAHPPT